MIRGSIIFAFGVAILGFAAQANADDAYSGVPPSARLVEHGTQMQVGRYTVVPSTPSDKVIEPLLVIAKLTFPRQTVVTIGGAINYVLMRTGYRLADEVGESAKAFLALPIPENQRSIGPYQVQDILTVLLGKSWNLTLDHRNRIVGFVSAPGFDSVEEIKSRNDALAQKASIAANQALLAAKAEEVEKRAALEATCSQWWHRTFDNACNALRTTKAE